MRAEAVDTRLVLAVGDLNQYVRNHHPGLANRRGLVNALIGRLLYLYVLVDRGIVGREWLEAVIERRFGSAGTFAREVLPQGVRIGETTFAVEEVWAVLDGIDALINGSVFPISSEERRAFPDDLIRLVHRVIRCGDVIEFEKRQVSFLDVSFEVLRTETISAIYQRFLKLEDETAQRREGAFYTPPFLADYVIARIDREAPMDEASRIVDAAAGSGVFLVSAYRRIMERHAPPGGWAPAHSVTARKLLCDCIYGIEKNPQAVNICRFSLYLTMLDYVGGARIEELAELLGEEKLLPGLDRNVIAGNAFRGDHFSARTFTHVVGNPPWGQPSRQRYDRNRGATDVVRPEPEPDPDRDDFAAGLDRTRQVAHGRISDLFVWLAETRLVKEGGIIGLILPTRSLVGRQSGRFASALASTTTIRFVGNLSHLRYRLFSGAKAPATVLIAKKHAPRPLDLVSVYRPRLSSLPLGRAGQVWSLLVSQTDIHPVRSRDLRSAENGWLAATMLSIFDRRMREALSTWALERNRMLGKLLDRSGLRMQRGGDPGETGVPQHIPPGRMKPVGLFPLDKERFAKVADPYRPLFSAGAVLVPRNFRGARLLDEPHAYRSTYYGVAARHRWAASRFTFDEDWAVATTIVTGQERDGLLGLVAFLNSGVAAYFASLFGATFLMENARLEKGDIAALPCPYENTHDPGLQALAEASEVDDQILDAMRAGPELRAAVREYVDFNKGFADAQLPGTAYNLVTHKEIHDFISRFEHEVRTNFTQAIKPMVRLDRRSGGTIALRVEFDTQSATIPCDDPASEGKFVASSVIAFDRDNRIGTVTKSEARFAWMSDQAVADAETLARLFRASNR
jgi:hypothetical protein